MTRNLGIALVSLLLSSPFGWGQTETASSSATPSATETSTATPTLTPIVFDFDPDLDHDGRIEPDDLLLFLRAWQVRDFLVVTPTATPRFVEARGFVSSASNSAVLAGVSVLAGTAVAETNSNGLFEMEQVRTDTLILTAAKTGFQVLEQPFDLEFPIVLFNLSLYPVGFPTRTVTPTHSATLGATATPTASGATPTPTRTFTPTPSVSRTPSVTRTRTRTPTVSRTPTPVQLLGTWIGDLDGDLFNGTDLVWTVTNGSQATAQIGRPNAIAFFSGTYLFSGINQVTYIGVNGASDISLEMTWDGADSLLDGTYSTTIEGVGSDSGSILDFGR